MYSIVEKPTAKSIKSLSTKAAFSHKAVLSKNRASNHTQAQTCSTYTCIQRRIFAPALAASTPVYPFTNTPIIFSIKRNPAMAPGGSLVFNGGSYITKQEQQLLLL